MSSSITELAEYQAKRKELISRDRSLRLDVLDQDNLSTLEIQADHLIRSIRAAEAESVWSVDYPSIPHPFPGMEFLTGRSIIVQTEIYKILCKMPKGALLHAHLDATVNASFLYDLGLQEPSMHVQVPKAINAQTLNTVLPKFKALPAELHNNEALSLTSPSYIPDSWLSLTQAGEQFDSESGGPDGFNQWVLGCLTINPAEAYGTYNTVTKVVIKVIGANSIEDGILYVEPRVNFWIKTMNVTHRELLMIFESILEETIVDLKARGREDEFVGAKLDWYFEDCIALKKEFPHLIVGFNLVGNENVLYPLSHYTEKLLNFRHMQKDASVDIPFILHARETLGDGSEADMNLYDTILLGTKRIGHG
ncbi:Metallo-dependent hydrolase [Guyanagaster necrorhizus]|uniref:Metallo-dependent hydrolase n=1 Tax=Guyanagaster necrorhizus TaxID=856835 RepID=A0A9P7VPJ2_9AGAR|nr:Metallo-dependent hydrolase [Guyanagaster necrorhizus MCA 3950]KAG7445036.1 Metallo-dependent hydrolase [Guyanagaster necrorhizus MCA 3950]